MATWNAFYVKSRDETAITAILRALPEAEIATIETRGDYIGVGLSEDTFEVPEKKLLKLSERLKTDVIWLSYQSAVDAFEFHHWHAGEHRRSLAYGCIKEQTWERVEGAPEPWEREVFFDKDSLKHALAEANTDKEKRQLRRIWKEAEILPGRTAPSLQSRACARQIARYFQLPHYRS